MLWVGWRQQRAEMLITGLILAAIAVLLIPTGLTMIHAYDDAGLASCVAHPFTDACSNPVSSFLQRFEGQSNALDWFTLVPGMFGVLLAARKVPTLPDRFTVGLEKLL